MPHLEPHAALTTCEHALRRLVAEVLSARDGARWCDANFDDRTVRNWRRKRDAEALTRGKRGHAATSADLLDFAELRELRGIIDEQWDSGFSTAFGGVDRQEIQVFLRRFEGLRLPVAHPRGLLPFEQDLLSGIAGDIQNRVTIHMSGKDPAGKHWPIVESVTVTDSFGSSVAAPSAATAGTATGLTLRPGQTITFTCTASDAQGRELAWFLRTQGERRGGVATGTDVQLQWLVAEHDVSETRQVEVCMMATGTIHHRMGPAGEDAVVVFGYQVLPGGA